MFGLETVFGTFFFTQVVQDFVSALQFESAFEVEGVQVLHAVVLVGAVGAIDGAVAHVGAEDAFARRTAAMENNEMVNQKILKLRGFSSLPHFTRLL